MQYAIKHHIAIVLLLLGACTSHVDAPRTEPPIVSPPSPAAVLPRSTTAQLVHATETDGCLDDRIIALRGEGLAYAEGAILRYAYHGASVELPTYAVVYDGVIQDHLVHVVLPADAEWHGMPGYVSGYYTLEVIVPDGRTNAVDLYRAVCPSR